LLRGGSAALQAALDSCRIARLSECCPEAGGGVIGSSEVPAEGGTQVRAEPMGAFPEVSYG